MNIAIDWGYSLSNNFIVSLNKGYIRGRGIVLCIAVCKYCLKSTEVNLTISTSASTTVIVITGV